MPWKTENLIGTKNGSNTDFTLSFVPIARSVVAVHQGIKLARVVNLPQAGEAQFGVAGAAVKVGTPPQSTEDLWATYFYVP